MKKKPTKTAAKFLALNATVTVRLSQETWSKFYKICAASEPQIKPATMIRHLVEKETKRHAKK